MAVFEREKEGEAEEEEEEEEEGEEERKRGVVTREEGSGAGGLGGAGGGRWGGEDVLRTSKVMMLLSCIATLTRKHGHVMRHGWRKVSECMLVLYELNVLPHKLSAMGWSCHSSQHVEYTIGQPKTQQQVQQQVQQQEQQEVQQQEHRARYSGSGNNNNSNSNSNSSDDEDDEEEEKNGGGFVVHFGFLGHWYRRGTAGRRRPRPPCSPPDSTLRQ